MPDQAANEHTEHQLDKTISDSFPASDPPAHSGITGVGKPKGSDKKSKAHRRQPSHQRGDDARPTGQPTSDRHATETAYAWEDGHKQ